MSKVGNGKRSAEALAKRAEKKELKVAEKNEWKRVGLGQADWDCLECNNQNFAKRTECNMCKCPKPKELQKEARKKGAKPKKISWKRNPTPEQKIENIRLRDLLEVERDTKIKCESLSAEDRVRAKYFLDIKIAFQKRNASKKRKREAAKLTPEEVAVVKETKAKKVEKKNQEADKLAARLEAKKNKKLKVNVEVAQIHESNVNNMESNISEKNITLDIDLESKKSKTTKKEKKSKKEKQDIENIEMDMDFEESVESVDNVEEEENLSKKVKKEKSKKEKKEKKSKYKYEVEELNKMEIESESEADLETDVKNTHKSKKSKKEKYNSDIISEQEQEQQNKTKKHKKEKKEKH